MSRQIFRSDMTDITNELNKRVDGDVRFDKMSRALWSTDASIYQIEPLGVVLPKHEDDVISVIEIANKFNVPVLPRGGGTSLAGSTIGEAIVIDFSQYMRSLKDINIEEKWVSTQPGIILDELNGHLSPEGVLFAPDPSTSNRGNVGGALGNNSCGAHSIMWGKTVDNVIEIDAILSDGSKTTFRQINGAALESKMRLSSLEGDIYRSLFKIGEENRDLILEKYPKIQRRVSGYNLDEFVNGNSFDMARFVVGSEGTLITITQAKLKVVSKPKLKCLAVLHCNDLTESMEATVASIEMNPAAVELIGSMILRQAQSNLSYSRLTDFIQGTPEALLVIELTGNSGKELDEKYANLERQIKRGGWGYTMLRLDSESDQQKVWDVRKAGLGLMMNVPGDAKPLPFVEDTAVAPHLLPDFVKRFDAIVTKHGTKAGYYGHASVGCLHIRPLINLKKQEDVDKMTSIAEEISDLVLEFGGALSGEHGDGLVRSGFNEKMFGAELYKAFKEVKSAFDPKGIMNPGKIVNAPPMTENLRYSPSYSTTLTYKQGFKFDQEGSYASAIEMCNGQGACKKISGGTMCPSYMVTRDEEHSTRGRANALRATISGLIPNDQDTSKRLYEVMDLCLECKGCKSECPSNVDMAKLKYEFLSGYHSANGYKLKNRFFGNTARLSKLGSFFAPISNWMIQSSASKDLIEKTIGIDKRRALPEFASQTFKQWFRSRPRSQNEKARHGQNGQVVLFADTTTNFNHPEIGKATVNLLEKLGYEVIVQEVRCCGRPLLSNGMLEEARKNVQYNTDLIFPYIESGSKLVGIEPSCTLGFRDDFGDLIGQNPRSNAIAANTMLVEEFVLYSSETNGDIQFSNPPQNERIMLHGQSHQKSLVGTDPALTVLGMIPGLESSEIPSGCCGMAGSFGFDVNHYDISMKMGELSLFPTIREQGNDATIVTEGVSCRQQIKDGTGRSSKHLVEILSKYI